MSLDVEFYKNLSAAAAKTVSDHFSELFRSRQRELLLVSIITFLFSVGIFTSAETMNIDFGFVKFDIPSQKSVMVLAIILSSYCLTVFILTTYQDSKKISHERVAVAAELNPLVEAEKAKRDNLREKIDRHSTLARQSFDMLAAAQKLEGEARAKAFQELNDFTQKSGLLELSSEITNNDALLRESESIVKVLATMKRLDFVRRGLEIWFPIILSAVAIISAIQFLRRH